MSNIKSLATKNFELLQDETLRQINEGTIDEDLVALDGTKVDILMTINNVANDYCHKVNPGSYCDQHTAKCRKR